MVALKVLAYTVLHKNNPVVHILANPTHTEHATVYSINNLQGSVATRFGGGANFTTVLYYFLPNLAVEKFCKLVTVYSKDIVIISSGCFLWNSVHLVCFAVLTTLLQHA